MKQGMLERSKGVPKFERLSVVDVMHPGIVTCPTETPLSAVARMMAGHRIHAVVVFDEESDDIGGAELWGVVSDLDLVKAASAGEIEDRTAGGTAVTPIVMVDEYDTVAHAAQLMSEHEIAHLIVVDPRTERPVGVLSTLDVACVLADACGEERR
jgi:CBS domain-containing protein